MSDRPAIVLEPAPRLAEFRAWLLAMRPSRTFGEDGAVMAFIQHWGKERLAPIEVKVEMGLYGIPNPTFGVSWGRTYWAYFVTTPKWPNPQEPRSADVELPPWVKAAYCAVMDAYYDSGRNGPGKREAAGPVLRAIANVTDDEEARVTA